MNNFCLVNFLDEYKPDGNHDDDDESCSSGVDENELDDDVCSEEDIEEEDEKVVNYIDWVPLIHEVGQVMKSW